MAATKTTVLVVAALVLAALALDAAAPAAAATDCKAGCAELSSLLGVVNCEKRCEAIAAQAQHQKDPTKSFLF